jgi:thymidylate synthase
MLARTLGVEPGDFVHTFGDLHLYANHVDQALTQLSRAPRSFPTLELAPRDDVFAYEFEDFTLRDYDPHPLIKAPVAV